MNDQPEILPGLEDSDSLRHPMWTAPKPEERLVIHLRALRNAIAGALVPLDGREGSEIIVDFIEEVYDITTFEMNESLLANYAWVMGRIAYISYDKRTRLQDWLDRDVPQPRTRPLYVRDIGVIERLGREFIEAICKAVHS